MGVGNRGNNGKGIIPWRTTVANCEHTQPRKVGFTRKQDSEKSDYAKCDRKSGWYAQLARWSGDETLMTDWKTPQSVDRIPFSELLFFEPGL